MSIFGTGMPVYKYIVVYEFTTYAGSGVGSVDVTFEAERPTLVQFRDLERKLLEKNKFQSLIITNMIPLALD